MTDSYLEARAYRGDLPPEGVSGQLTVQGDRVVFAGEDQRLELSLSSPTARIGGLDERFLFLSSSGLPGLEVAVDRQQIEASNPLLALPSVARALQQGRGRRRRFWACLLALAAVLVFFALMILILFSVIARAAMGATSSSPPPAPAESSARARLQDPSEWTSRYRLGSDATPYSASERRASRP